jgi:IS5 family transposase
VETLLAATIQAGLNTGAVRPWSLERVSVEITVQPKAVTHPTDAKLYLKALQALVRLLLCRSIEEILDRQLSWMARL